jgi:hypothetical protein
MADLYVFFYYRGLQLLSPSGMLIFISSNKWLRTGYGAKLRSELSEDAVVNTIIDFGDLPVFEAATAYPMVIAAQHGIPRSNVRFMRVMSLQPPYPDVTKMLEFGSMLLPADTVTGTMWSLDRPSPVLSVGSGTSSVLLQEYVNGQIFNGVKSGLSRAFVIDRATYEALADADTRSATLLKPTVEGSDLKKFSIRHGDKFVIYIRWQEDLNRYPAIAAHLQPFYADLAARNGVTNGGSCPWYALIRPRPESAQYYEKKRILFPDIAPSPRFGLDEVGLFPQNTAYCIISDERYLLGVLNSSSVAQIYATLSPQVRGGYFRFTRQYVERIPIPLAKAPERLVIAELVQKRLDASGQGPQVTEWEAEIDERVAWLYGLKSPPGRPEAVDDDA